MYRSLVASLLLFMMVLTQGITAEVCTPTKAQSHFLSDPKVAVLHPFYISPGQFDKTALQIQKSFLEPNFFEPVGATKSILLAIEMFISRSDTSDHARTWIEKVFVLLYPAHEFS